MSKSIQITINEEDKNLFEFVKNCKDEQALKNCLTCAADLYTFCNGSFDELPGYLTPENYKAKTLSKLDKAKLLKLKKEYEKNVLLLAQEFHPDEVDCGIMRGSDTEYWFIGDDSKLGLITLYSNYIKMIKEVLDEKSK